MPLYVLIVVGLIGVAYSIWTLRQRREEIIAESHIGMSYKDGVFVQKLSPGRHIYFPPRGRIDVFDLRKKPLWVAGQEVLTKDNISLRISVVGFFRIEDIDKAVFTCIDHYADVYSMAQLAIRQVVGAVNVEELLADKSSLNETLGQKLAEQALTIGLDVTNIAILDIMLPATLKKAFSGVLEAQKEAQKNLEKARGEQAVLRSLANSAKLYQENPALLRARLVQALSTGNNSIVFQDGDRPDLSIG